jgi:hypothetical protein
MLVDVCALLLVGDNVGNVCDFSEENLGQTSVVLCASMQTPWHILPQLHKWATILEVNTEEKAMSCIIRHKNMLIDQQCKSDSRSFLALRLD